MCPENPDFLGPEMTMSQASGVWAQKSRATFKSQNLFHVCIENFEIFVVKKTPANMLDFGAQIGAQRSAAETALSRGSGWALSCSDF